MEYVTKITPGVVGANVALDTVVGAGVMGASVAGVGVAGTVTAKRCPALRPDVPCGAATVERK